MARRRSYRGVVSLGSYIDGDVKPVDVIVGGLVGLGVGALVKYAIAKAAPTVLAQVETAIGADYAGAVMPILTGFSSAAVIYLAETKLMPSMSSKAQGHAIGAAVGGLVLGAFSFLQKNATTKAYFNPSVGGYGDYRGLLVDNAAQRQMGGLLVDNANLGNLGIASMGGDDEMGYADIVSLTS